MQDVAQRNIVLLKEPEMMKRAPLRKASSFAGTESITTKMVSHIRFLPMHFSIDDYVEYRKSHVYADCR